MLVRSTGLGEFTPQSANAVAGAAGTVASAVAGQVIGSGASAGAAAASGAAVAGASLAASIAVPLIGTLVALGLSFFLNRRGGKQKLAATKIVEDVEPFLDENVKTYLAAPVRTRSAQAAALANFDEGWNYVLQNCSNPELAAAGERCISERRAGGQWDWFSYYRDPIANDAGVVDDSTVILGGLFGPGSVASGSFDLASLLPLAAMVVGAFGLISLMGDSK